MRLAFGDCVFDSDQRELSRAGRVQHVTPKAFALLELLLRERPRAFSKSELMDRLWADVAVSDGSLANLVAELRKALGEGAKGQRYLKTLHGFGYAFPAAVRELGADEASRAGFQLMRDGRAYALKLGENVVGRSSECEICLDSTTVSRQHARLQVEPEAAWLTDLDSKNGTLLNGEPVRGGPHRLNPGDRVQVGAVRLVLRAPATEGATDTFVGEG